MAFDMPKRKKSRRPGTLTSHPSCSITRTTSLFAVGWNLTRISPTTPTRGLVRSLTSGSTSNASIVSLQSAKNSLRLVLVEMRLFARSLNLS